MWHFNWAMTDQAASNGGIARRWRGSPQRRPGYQRHHLIPIALLGRGQIADMFGHLRSSGFALRQFDQNGLFLPACEWLAEQTGHALHRGPHGGYTDVVTARVDMIRATFDQASQVNPSDAATVAIMRLRTLQAAMRRALTDRHGIGFWLNRRDPMKLFADRSYLDDAIDRIYGCRHPAWSAPISPGSKGKEYGDSDDRYHQADQIEG